jgi:uncharacterized iron-regulated membrane protein
MSAVETTAAAPARRRARRGRSLWWRVHQWAGLQASLYLAFVLVTGTLAVLAHEIDWLLRPAMWVSPTEVEERVSWGTVAEAVTAHAPGAQVLMLSAPLHAASAFDAVIVRNGERRHVYVHPRTGTVTGEGTWMSVQRFLRDAHRRLMLFQTVGGVRVGIVLVCLSSVLLLVSLVTSFWVYKKWWRGFLRWPRGRDARSLTGDTHRFLGLWSLWFVVVMTWTGLWYLAEEFGARPPLPPLPALSATLPAHDTMLAQSLDRGIAALEHARPDYQVTFVLWPSAGSPAFAVRGRDDRAMLVEDAANSVWIAADDGRLLGEIDAAALSLHQRLAAANNPLHFGTFAGYPSKVVYFVFGVGLSALSLTGVAIYGLRLLKPERSGSWRRGLLLAWQGMGRARWPAAALCVLPFILVFFQ